MARVQTGNELAIAILKALGIPGNMVLSVELGMKPNEIATVTVTRAIDSDEMGSIAAELTQYELVQTGHKVRVG